MSDETETPQPDVVEPSEQGPLARQPNRLALVLALLLLISIGTNVWSWTRDEPGSTSGGGSLTERHFDSPEAATRFVIDHIARGEFVTATQACSTEELGKNFDIDMYLERIGAWLPQAGWAPSDDTF